MAKTLLIALAILIVLLGVYFFISPSDYTSTQSADLSPSFRKFRDTKFDDVAKIELKKGKTQVELKKDPAVPAGWVVASAHDYPADKDRVEKILKSLDEIEEADEQGTSESSHDRFEVDAKKGGFITLRGKDDKELAKIVVGTSARGGGISSNRIFARFGDDVRTYRIESNVRSEASLYGKDAEAKNYLQKELFKVPEGMDVESVRLIRPEKPDLLVERRQREVPVEKPKDAAADAEPKDGEPKEDEAKKEEEKKPETKKEEYFVVTSGTETVEVGKSEEWTAKGLLNRGKTISIDDAAEPKGLAEYGLDKPQLKAVIGFRKKDTPDDPMKTVSVVFGNAKKDEKGETQSYYFLVEDEASKGRIYLVQDYKFNEWAKEMKDFLPKPKEPEKPKDAPAPSTPAPDAGGVPPAAPEGAPATPAPGTAPADAAGAAPAPATDPAKAPDAKAPEAKAPEGKAPEGKAPPEGRAKAPEGAPSAPAGGPPPPPPAEGAK